MSNKKVYVLIVSKQFPKTHPKAGHETGFINSIIENIRGPRFDRKIHTIRGNFKYWSKIADEVNSGRAVLSLRCWTGRPYNSKQHEFFELSKIGIQRVQILNTQHEMEINVEDKATPLVAEVAKNDGLSPEDFTNWFFPKMKISNYNDCVFDGAIIHFTDFRY